MSWSIHDVGDLTGKRAIVTGVTGGLGHHVTLELARAGASVTATARDSARGADAVAAIRAEVPGADVEVVQLDLADLASVRTTAHSLVEQHPAINILVNNAGVMATPERTTADGFELQIGTNHLGAFALTGLLWPALAAGSARVVAVSSLAHKTVRGIDLRSLERAGSTPFRRYRRWRSYGESKLADLVFAQELDRRARAAGTSVTGVAAHPGYSSTELQKTGPSMGGKSVGSVGLALVTKVAGQSAAAGAGPLLMAATMPGLAGGSYVGPGSLGETRGAPKLVGMTKPARDPELARRLWESSEQATGVAFP